jgi:hypothetical protein
MTTAPAAKQVLQQRLYGCRVTGLNYGYVEQRQVNLFEDAGYAILAQTSTSSKHFDWAPLTLELDSYMDEVHSLVRAIYRA